MERVPRRRGILSSVERRFKPTVLIALTLAVLLSGCSRPLAPTRPIEDPRTTAIATVKSYLAGEHAAIWAYGRAAGLLPKAELRLALLNLARHKRERDQLTRQLRTAGVTPVGALVAYDEGAALENAQQALNFLTGVEARLTALALAVKDIPSKP